MSTAQAYYELFKSLHPKTKQKVRSLIQEDELTIYVSVRHLKGGLKNLKLVKQGKLKARPLEELLIEIENAT